MVRALAILLALLIASPLGAQPAPLQMQQNGVNQGAATTLNCKGNVSCVKRGTIYDVDASVGGAYVYNVRDYGATGVGTDTQTTALQAASDACKTAGGGTIYAPRGTYKAARWTIGSNCTLRGDGIDATIFKCTDTAPDQCILIGDSTSTAASDVGMESFTLDARGVTRIAAVLGGYVRGIGTVVGSSDITIDGIKIIDGGRRAIEIINSNHASVTRSTLVTPDGDGIHFDGAGASGTCTDVKAVANTVRGAGDVAIAADYCDGVNFTGNTVEGAASGNSRTENGLDVSGSSNVVVADNVVRGVRNACLLASGFRVNSTDYTVKHAAITGNTCKQLATMLTGLCVGGSNAGAQCAVASGCPGGTCSPVNHAINVLGCSTTQSVLPCSTNTYATDIIIADNHLYDTPGVAIMLATLVDGFSITGNAIRNPKYTGASGTGDAAIQLASSSGNIITNGSITGNLIVGDAAHLGNGIFASGSGVSNVRIANNPVTGIARTADVRITSGNSSGVVARGQNFSAADLTGGGDLVSAGNGSHGYCDTCALGSIPCAGSGTGATAQKVNDAWNCGAVPDAAATPPFNQPLAIATGVLTQEFTNSSPGTLTAGLVRLTSSGTAQRTAAGDTKGVVGICVSGCGDNPTGPAHVAVEGRTPCSFDANAVTIGDYVGISTTTAGACTDLGANPPANVQIVGRAMQAGAGSADYLVLLGLHAARYTPTPTPTASASPTISRTPTPTPTNTSGVYGPQACSGSDKVASIDAAGNISCSSDLQGSGGPTATAVTPTPTPVVLSCPTGVNGDGGVRSISDTNGFNVAVGCLATSTATATPTVTVSPTATATPTPTATVSATPTNVTIACPTAADGSGGGYSVTDRNGFNVALGCLPTSTVTVSPTPTASPTATASVTPTAVACAANFVDGVVGPGSDAAATCIPIKTPVYFATPTVTATPSITAPGTATPTPTVTSTAFVCGAGFVLDRAHPEACVELPTPDGGGAGYPTPTVVVSATPTAYACPTNGTWSIGGLFGLYPPQCLSLVTPTPTATATVAPTPQVAFVTIDAAGGTDPVADNAADTLTLTSYNNTVASFGSNPDTLDLSWDYTADWTTIDMQPGECVPTNKSYDPELVCSGGTNDGTLCSAAGDARECRGGGTCTGSVALGAKGGFICATVDGDSDNTVLLFDRVSGGDANVDAKVHVPYRTGTIAVQGDIGLTISKAGGSTGVPSGGVVSFEYTNTLAGDPALGEGQCIFSSGSNERGLVCEGATANGIETALLFDDPTSADKTVHVPNADGVLVVSAVAPLSISALGAISVTTPTAVVSPTPTAFACPTNGAYGLGGLQAEYPGVCQAIPATVTPVPSATPTSFACPTNGAYGLGGLQAENPGVCQAIPATVTPVPSSTPTAVACPTDTSGILGGQLGANPILCKGLPATVTPVPTRTPPWLNSDLPKPLIIGPTITASPTATATAATPTATAATPTPTVTVTPGLVTGPDVPVQLQRYLSCILGTTGNGELLCAGTVASASFFGSAVDGTELSVPFTVPSGTTFDFGADSSAAPLAVPRKADTSAITTEGYLAWDSDDDILGVGTGTKQRQCVMADGRPQNVGATPTPTATSTGATPTPTATVTATPVPTVTHTAGGGATPTSTAAPTVTPTPAPTVTPALSVDGHPLPGGCTIVHLNSISTTARYFVPPASSFASGFGVGVVPPLPITVSNLVCGSASNPSDMRNGDSIRCEFQRANRQSCGSGTDAGTMACTNQSMGPACTLTGTGSSNDYKCVDNTSTLSVSPDQSYLLLITRTGSIGGAGSGVWANWLECLEGTPAK